MIDGDSRRSEVTQMQVRSDDKYEGGTWDFPRIAVVYPGGEGE